MLTKIVLNSRKTSESYKTRENAFDKLVSDYSSVSFRIIFGKLENRQKTLGKRFWAKKFRKSFGKFSVNIRTIFVFAI